MSFIYTKVLIRQAPRLKVHIVLLRSLRFRTLGSRLKRCKRAWINRIGFYNIVIEGANSSSFYIELFFNYYTLLFLLVTIVKSAQKRSSKRDHVPSVLGLFMIPALWGVSDFFMICDILSREVMESKTANQKINLGNKTVAKWSNIVNFISTLYEW